jgi:hypothetical protein
MKRDFVEWSVIKIQTGLISVSVPFHFIVQPAPPHHQRYTKPSLTGPMMKPKKANRYSFFLAYRDVDVDVDICICMVTAK